MHTQKPTKATVSDLQRQLDEADRKRREVLGEMFLNHADKIEPAFRLLIEQASKHTLNKLEGLLMFSGIEEGGSK